MTARRADLLRRAALCFAVAESATIAGERDAARRRGEALRREAELLAAPGGAGGDALGAALSRLGGADDGDFAARIAAFHDAAIAARLRDVAHGRSAEERGRGLANLLAGYGIHAYPHEEDAWLVYDGGGAFELDKPAFFQFAERRIAACYRDFVAATAVDAASRSASPHTDGARLGAGTI